MPWCPMFDDENERLRYKSNIFLNLSLSSLQPYCEETTCLPPADVSEPPYIAQGHCRPAGARRQLNSQPKKSGLYGLSACNKVCNHFLEFYVKDTFSTLFCLQSEYKQKFVPSLVWKLRGFKVDMSISKRWPI